MKQNQRKSNTSVLVSKTEFIKFEMAKKGKKGKKGKKEVATGPQPFTTTQIVHDRTKMLCPRMGDVYGKSMNVEIILEVLLHHYKFLLDIYN
jgi:hypothetical protein